MESKAMIEACRQIEELHKRDVGLRKEIRDLKAENETLKKELAKK
tara:strand:+ start:76 stop:210 length:135 start_codon:yes stop_codon:yes gene_type:complete